MGSAPILPDKVTVTIDTMLLICRADIFEYRCRAEYRDVLRLLACKQEIHQGFETQGKTGVSVAPQKWHMSSKN